MARQRPVSDESATAVMDQPSETESTIRMGEIVIYTGRAGAKSPAIATADEKDGHLDLTAFPRGLAPLALLNVACDPEGGRDFSWRRR